MQLVLPNTKGPRILKMDPTLNDDDLYFEFCQRNRKLRIERTSEGEIVICGGIHFTEPGGTVP